MVQTLLGVSLPSVVAVLAGLVSAWTGVVVYRGTGLGSGGEFSDLVVPFIATTLTFTAVAFAYPVVELVAGTQAVGGVPLMALVAVSVPWTVFALRYAGRGAFVTPGRVAFASLVAVSMLSVFVTDLSGILPEGWASVTNFVGSLLVLGILGGVSAASGLVIVSTYRHGTTSSTHGAVVVLPIVLLVMGGQVNAILGFLTAAVTTALTLALTAFIFALSVRRYDLLTLRPGTGALGERAVVDTMSEAFLVVDRRGTVIRTNQQGEYLFGSETVGAALEDVLDVDLDTLRDRETVEQWTDHGHRRFDPRVSTLTDGRSHELGHNVTLLDVTDREIKRQRIQVLNRILRHNLRNDLSVIGARAEVALDETDGADDHLETIADVADDLEQLSANARKIETLMSDQSPPDEAVALDELVSRSLDDVTARHESVDTVVAVPSTAVSLDPGLLGYAVRNLVENAVEHNDGDTPTVEVRGSESQEGVRLVVADDGPGLPESERSVIESGAEQPHEHASSLGLWGTNWAVQTLGGDLSFDRSDMGGAAVVIDLPTTTGE